MKWIVPVAVLAVLLAVLCCRQEATREAGWKTLVGARPEKPPGPMEAGSEYRNAVEQAKELSGRYIGLTPEQIMEVWLSATRYALTMFWPRVQKMADELQAKWEANGVVGRLEQADVKRILGDCFSPMQVWGQNNAAIVTSKAG